MADYGLVIRNSSGVITLDTTDTISRLRYSTTAAAGESGNVTLSDIDGKTTVQFAMTETAWGATSTRLSHYVYRSGTTIYWEPQRLTDDWFQSGVSRIVVFLYS